MKRGYYAVDVNNVGKGKHPIRFMGERILSWEHAQARKSGREVWWWSPQSDWKYSPVANNICTKPIPKIVQMMDLLGAM